MRLAPTRFKCSGPADEPQLLPRTWHVGRHAPASLSGDLAIMSTNDCTNSPKMLADGDVICVDARLWSKPGTAGAAVVVRSSRRGPCLRRT
jgi:hypothetical protein